MCTTCWHDVVVGFGGSVVVLVVVVVLVELVEVVDVVDELVDVVAGSVDDGGATVVAVPTDDDGVDTTVVVGVPSVDWTCSLHAVSARSTRAPVAMRLIPRSRPTAPPRVGTSLPALEPSTRRDGR
jgi:hypothetical protein